jgi:hypothetical protein
MKNIYFLIILGVLLISNCKKIEGPEGKISLVDLIVEPAGTNCSSGGFKIVTGIDKNGNKTLDAEEIQQTKYVCNGVDGVNGYNSLVSEVVEPIGTNCSNGGFKITSGIDLNRNGSLDANEIQQTKYLCNGIDGAYDKQINFKLYDGISSPNGASLATIYKYSDGYGGIVKFNIDNYINIDSAIIVAYDLTTRDSFNGNIVSGTMKIELFDCKNSQVIANSEINSGEIPSGSSVSSKNFLNNLPHMDIELGIKLTKGSDFYAETKDIVFILFRH